MTKLALPAINLRSVADDFRNLNPKDVGTWPTVPKVTVLIVLFIVIVFAGWWFVWNDQIETLEAKKNEEASLKTQYLDKKKQAINLDLYTQQLNEIDRSFGALLKQLPNKSEVENLLVEINQAGLGRGLQFELFRPGQEAAREFYAELPVTIKLTGSYHDLGAFASDIGKLSRIVTLNNLSITSVRDGMLTLDALSKTFRYLDEEEVAKQRKAADAKKAGAKK
jgi:type IV pilus assembly protein PilO